jgi:hypothetical protein
MGSVNYFDSFSAFLVLEDLDGFQTGQRAANTLAQGRSFYANVLSSRRDPAARAGPFD